MPKFILIEQSLSKVGGHYYEYSLEILRAAEASGYAPCLALNRAFPETERFPESWQVLPLFPYNSDRIHRVPRAYNGDILRKALQGQRNWRDTWFSLTEGLGDSVKSVISPLRKKRHRQRIAGFADACRELFERIDLEAGDQVLCSTMADADLLGLVSFLESHPESRKADWHLQFHFNIFAGRNHEYERQEDKSQKLKQRLRLALDRVPDHRTHFYTTTDLLGEQFAHVTDRKLRTLPWPVGKRFHFNSSQSSDPDAARPVRLALAGAVRREKGGDFVRRLVDELWDDYLGNGRLQLVLQSNQKQRSRSMLDLPADAVCELTDVQSDGFPDSPIVMLPHPLDDQQYANYIRSADIGLLLYHADEYYVRCSGILVEMLAAGVPVIAPGGCWLSQQICSVNQAYLRQINRTGKIEEHMVLDEARSLQQSWKDGGFVKGNQPASLLLNRRTTDFELDFQPQAHTRYAMLRGTWARRVAGDYVRVRAEQYDQKGTRLCAHEQLVEQEPAAIEGAAANAAKTGEPEFYCMFEVQPGATRAKLSLGNAYSDRRITLTSPVVELLEQNHSAAATPISSVGLTFGQPGDISRLVREMVQHIGHYRETARDFARRWCQQHAPERTIEIITHEAESLQCQASVESRGRRESAA